MEARDPPRDAEAIAILKALQRGEPRAAASRLLIHRRVLDDVARFLVDERLGVYAFATTQSLALGALWPAPALERLRDQWQRQQQRNATLQGALAEIDSAFDRVGPFDESLRIGVEVDWYARLCEAGLRTAMLDTVVLRRRLHRSNSSVRFPGEQSERLRVLKQALDRRRAAAARRT